MVKQHTSLALDCAEETNTMDKGKANVCCVLLLVVVLSCGFSLGY